MFVFSPTTFPQKRRRESEDDGADSQATQAPPQSNSPRSPPPLRAIPTPAVVVGLGSEPAAKQRRIQAAGPNLNQATNQTVGKYEAAIVYHPATIRACNEIAPPVHNHSEVIKTAPDVLARMHPYETDARLQLITVDNRHDYYVDNMPVSISVSGLYAIFFPEFPAAMISSAKAKGKNFMLDPKNARFWDLISRTSKYGGTDTPARQIRALWAADGQIASTSGTNMHALIGLRCQTIAPVARIREARVKAADGTTFTLTDEQFATVLMLEETYMPEMVQWASFFSYMTGIRGLKLWRSEQLVYAPDLDLCGAIDAQFRDAAGDLYIVDFKRSTKLADPPKRPGDTGYGPLKCLPSSNLGKYCAQGMAYSLIKTDYYHERVKEYYILSLHPDLPNYEIRSVPMNLQPMREVFALRREQWENGESLVDFTARVQSM